MAYSYNEVGAISPGQTITVPFKFLERSHVRVLVDGVATANFAWLNDGLLQAAVGFPAGTITRVERNTPVGLLKAVLEGTAVFDWGGVNDNFYLILYVLQEYVDKEVVRNAQIEQIFNGFDRVEIAVTEAKEAAARAADDAAAGALAALEAVIAEIRQTAINAQEAADNANLAAGRAATEAAEAVADVLRQAMEATERAIAEAQKATEAADRASQFDPSGFYTKTDADDKFLTLLTAQNDFYTKAYISQNHYTKTAVDAGLAGKLSLSTGGELNGDVAITKSVPTLVMHYPGVVIWRMSAISNGNVIFADANGNPIIQFGPTGNIHTAQFGDLNTRIEDRAAAWRNDAIANIMPTVAAQGAGAVGTYALVRTNNQANNPGEGRSGTELYWANTYGSNIGAVGYGYWRCMGYANASNGGGSTTLWMRYA